MLSSVCPPKSFQHEKSQCLAGVDWSRKGSIDAPIEKLVHYVNKLPPYFTTSSCSGRVCLYEQNIETQKQGCKWLLTSHEAAKVEQVVTASEESCGDAFFKFEAFVMHIQCWRLEDAQTMAIRSTHGLEAPVTVQGKPLVDHQYLEHLTRISNDKMEENFLRINRFFTNLKEAIEKQAEAIAKPKIFKEKHCKTAPVSVNTSPQDNQDSIVEDCAYLFDNT